VNSEISTVSFAQLSHNHRDYMTPTLGSKESGSLSEFGSYTFSDSASFTCEENQNVREAELNITEHNKAHTQQVYSIEEVPFIIYLNMHTYYIINYNDPYIFGDLHASTLHVNYILHDKNNAVLH